MGNASMPKGKPRSSYRKGSNKRRRVAKPRYAKGRRKAKLPRFALKKGIRAAPNTYPFMRSHTHYFNIGEANANVHAYVNQPDVASTGVLGKYMIIKLNTKINKLPGLKDATDPATGIVGHNDFDSLFQQYKITSVKHTLTPNFQAPAPMAANGSNIHNAAQIPTYEMFVLRSDVIDEDKNDLKDLKDSQIEAYLQCKLNKSRKILPRKTLSFMNTRPKVVKWDTAGFKRSDTHFSTASMESPSWYCLDPTNVHPTFGHLDETDITHYTYDLLIRRVDDQPLTQITGTNIHATLGFRVETQVGFMCRATPKDILTSGTPTV